MKHRSDKETYIVRCWISHLHRKEHQSAGDIDSHPRVGAQVRLHIGPHQPASGDGECVVREAEEFGLLCVVEEEGDLT